MRIFIFLLILFFIGGFGMIFTDQMRILLVLGICVNIFMEPKLFWHSCKKYKNYILISLIFVGYMLIHTLFLVNFSSSTSFHFGFIELLGFYLVGIPIYVLSTKTFMNNEILYKGFLLFCIGVLLCNSWMCIELCRTQSPNQSVMGWIEFLWTSRFGANKNILGGHIFLEAQAMSLGLSALILFYFSCVFRDIRYKILLGAGFALSGIFVLLTVTKSSLLALSICSLILIYRLYHRISLMNRIALLSLVFIFSISVWSILPDSFHLRISGAEQELAFLVSNDASIDSFGNNISILPRVMIYNEIFNHIDEFGYVGLGALAKNSIPEWFNNSQYSSYLLGLTDPHNSFVYFWILGGIVGLIYILYMFFVSIYLMFTHKIYSYLIISLLLFMFITNNTCTLMDINDSRGIIILFLTIFYFYFDNFLLLEKNGTNK